MPQCRYHHAVYQHATEAKLLSPLAPAASAEVASSWLRAGLSGSHSSSKFWSEDSVVIRPGRTWVRSKVRTTWESWKLVQPITFWIKLTLKLVRSWWNLRSSLAFLEMEYPTPKDHDDVVLQCNHLFRLRSVFGLVVIFTDWGAGGRQSSLTMELWVLAFLMLITILQQARSLCGMPCCSRRPRWLSWW